jgi:DNA polymerase III alpha subunit (gram-positive type)
VNWGLLRLRNKMLQLRIGGRSLDHLARRNLHALDGLRLDAPARAHSYVVMNLETTGRELGANQVTGVGALRVVDGRVRLGEVFNEPWHQEGAPTGAEAPGASREPHGPWKALESFLAFAGTDILVAHGASFQAGVLRLAMKSNWGFAMQNLVLDTLEMCRALLLKPGPQGLHDDMGRCGLETLALTYELEAPESHNALGDALTTALIFQRFVRMMELKGLGTLGDLIRIGALAP